MLGKRLKELRAEKGYTLAQVGKEVGISEATLSNYENSARKPDWETIIKFADFYNVTTDYILGRTNIKKFKEIKDLDMESLEVITIARGASKLNNIEKKAVLNVIDAFIQSEQNKKNLDE